MESLDNILLGWMYLLEKKKVAPELLAKCYTPVFNKYVEYHLSPPHGCRLASNGTGEIDDNEETDRVRFKTQLQVIGSCGRFVPSHSLPLLYK